MKNYLYTSLLFLASLFISTGCSAPASEGQTSSSGIAVVGERKAETKSVHLSDLKFNNLNFKIDTLSTRVLSGVVTASGHLEVPPQHEATVTAIIGANVTSIAVIEGDEVRKNQVLGYLTHPNLIQIQTNYIKAFSRQQYLEKELQRQKRLYDEEVGSGQAYQESLSDYQGLSGEVTGYELQLKQLGLNTSKIQQGEIFENVPVKSPIDGFIEKVLVRIGQYVAPQDQMFLVVNNEHVHADLMVYEKDVHKVKKGQKVTFSVESLPNTRLTAKIFSVGKQFEETPKAVHVHAEIIDMVEGLIPGMFINGNIESESLEVLALPEEAIITEDNRSYLFKVEKKEDGEGKVMWDFQPIEIKTGISHNGWTEVKLLEPLSKGAKIAWNNAYYIVAEMNKSAAGHSH